MPVCPFCKVGYSPRAIQWVDEKYDDKTDTFRTVESFECNCGAWWYEGMEDEQN
jgi:hypothetical protein